MQGSVKLPPIRLTRMSIFVTDVGLDHDTWQELESWSSVTRTEISKWEAVALRNMARIYRDALAKFNNVNVPAPWTDKDFDREAVANQMRRALRGK